MFQQLGSFAEFERNRIAERVFPEMVKGVQNSRGIEPSNAFAQIIMVSLSNHRMLPLPRQSHLSASGGLNSLRLVYRSIA